MTQRVFERTRLWKSSFGKQEDGNTSYRERLEQGFLRFRDRVSPLLSFIPRDMHAFTVHDISHLDALWEMADLICGESYPLNPAEAFVFGGAVLLHDAGMTIAAYQRGVEEIKETEVWRDSLAFARERFDTNSKDSGRNGDHEIESAALIDALRLLHAEQSERLATQFWTSPDGKERHHLCEDSDLRNHYGSIIGKIAHSHHWDIRRLQQNLKSPLGSFGEMPPEWTVDPIKVALMLRCSDAAHIDSRRAPKLL